MVERVPQNSGGLARLGSFLECIIYTFHRAASAAPPLGHLFGDHYLRHPPDDPEHGVVDSHSLDNLWSHSLKLQTSLG